MILSHCHQFIFVKTQKTAGTSIEIALSEHCGGDDIITPLDPPDEEIRTESGRPGPQNWREPLSPFSARDWGRRLLGRRPPARFYNHMSATKIRERVDPAVWNGYFKFCFERNPWDKVVSFYYFHREFSRERFEGRDPPTLEEFIRAGWANASDFDRYTINGEVAMDFIGRYESLDSDLRIVWERIGLPGVPALPRAKSGFRTDRRPYVEMYGPEERDEVERIFAREIEHFGYRFEGP